MTKEERIEELHRKMSARKRQKENLRTAAMGTGSLVLCVCLVLLIGSTGFMHTGTTAGLYSGATLLFGNAGGYVLTAIAAFMAGVVITVLMRNKQNKQKTGGESK
jgi:hypothetical protein